LPTPVIARLVLSRYHAVMDDDQATHIAALVERIGRLLNTEAHAEGLLPVQWETLRYLNKANRFSRTAAALTAYLGITKGTVSQTLKTLESRRLVKKQVDRRDRRSNQLSTTAKGRKMLESDPLAVTVGALNRLDKPAQKALSNGLESLLSMRLAAQDRRPFGQCRNCRFFTPDHAEGSPNYCLLLQETLSLSDAGQICCEQIAK